MNRFLKIDGTGNWNTVPAVPDDKMKNVNCHKFVLYVIGRLSWEEMVSASEAQKEPGLDFTFGEEARNISNAPFTSVDDVQSLYSLAARSCESGKTYVDQILDAQTEKIAHSFIVERASDGTYACIEKQGFKYPFSIHELGTLLAFVNKDGERSYQNQKWRFVPISRAMED